MNSRSNISNVRGYAAIGLHHPKNRYNVGAVIRAAGCYGAALVAITGERYRRAHTDTQAAYKHLPVINTESLQSVVPVGCVPVAVELIPSSRPLAGFLHPESAFYLFGPEDGTLGPEIISWCKHVVYIPTRYCMNLSATVNVLLYDRAVKRGFPVDEPRCKSQIVYREAV